MKSYGNAIAVATALLALPLGALALSTQGMQTTNRYAQTEAARMEPANAAVLHNLDAKKDHPGSAVRVRLTTTVHLQDGTKLPSGTTVIGRVVQDNMYPQSSSKLALRFTQAELKDGKVIPIKATIVGIYGPQATDLSGYPVKAGTQAPISWSDHTVQIDQINALPGVDLHSKVASKNSGVLISKKQDVKVDNGSEIQLAIAPRANRLSASTGSAGQS